jgi:hypothetical protein
MIWANSNILGFQKSYIAFMIVCWLIAPVFLFLPLTWLDSIQVFGNSDALFYSNILTFVTERLKQGEIFPRWFAEANAGFGSPVMWFYPPFAYILSAVFTIPLSLLHIQSTTQFFVGIYASQVISGITSFLWLRRSFDKKIALFGSVLFILLPYKILYIYLHINLAQLWALAFLPLWMMAAEFLVAKNTRAIGFYALMMAAVFYTHPLTVIAFGLVPCAYVLWFGRKNFSSYIMLGLAHILGIGVCAMQLIPQHMYMDWIQSKIFFAGKYSWKDNFYHVDVLLCAYYGMVAIMVAYTLYFLPELRKKIISRVAFFWIGVLCIVAFLTQRPSTFIWEYLPLLHYLQFPAARLHAAALMAVIYLICIWWTFYDEMLPLSPRAYHKGMLVVFIIIFGSATFYNIAKINMNPANRNKQYIDARGGMILPAVEYKTRWGCMDVGKAFDLYMAHLVPPPIIVTEGKAAIIDIKWHPEQRSIFKINTLTKQAFFILRQCYWPLWKAYDEKGEVIPLIPDAKQGLITFALPQGSHEISISMGESSLERYSLWISSISLLVSILIMFRGSRKYYNSIK